VPYECQVVLQESYTLAKSGGKPYNLTIKMLWRRLKNLWEMSSFRPKENMNLTGGNSSIVKDFPTMKKKLATIIQPERSSGFEKMPDDNPSK
jgi:hypothetical protein